MRHEDDPVRTLAPIATRLSREAGEPAGAPSLYGLTDPVRTPCPLTIAERLPAGAVLIYRAFGAEDAAEVGRALRRVCDRRGVRLLVGADEVLAARVGADGVHLPERLAHRLVRVRRRRPCWWLTAAAHGGTAARRAAQAGADAVFVSPVFPSASASAGRPLGVLRLAALVRGTPAPVIALGGVTAATAVRLCGTGVAGLAAVDAFRTGTRSPAEP